MIFNEPWCNGVDLDTIVQGSHASLSIDSSSGYVLNPIPSGSGFKKGVCIWFIMPGVSCPRAPLAWSPFLEGLRLTPLVPSPLFSLNAISDKVIWATTVVTALLLLLNILHCSDKAYYELFGYAFNAIWVFTVNAFLLVDTLFLQVYHSCRRGHG